MKPGKVLLTSILLILLPGNNALAAQKGLFLMENLTQSVNLSYQYNRQDVSGGGSHTSASQNRFQEFYNFDIKYAIYNPRILNGRISAKARADQDFLSSNAAPSSSSSGAGFQYYLDGLFLERGYTPIQFFSGSELTHVQNSFSPGYDLTVDSMGIGTSIRNRIVPITVEYRRYANETSGLSEDRTQTNDQVSVRAKHTVPSVSQTDLDLFRTNSRSEPKGGRGAVDTNRSAEASLINDLTWKDNRYSVRSALRFRDELHLGKTENFDWQESFSWRLGPALHLGLGYNNSSSTFESSITNISASRTSNAGKIWLTHKLYRNLTSQLEVNARQADLTNGKEKEYSGTLSFNYVRSLPNNGSLNLRYSELLTVIDRDLTSGETLAPSEPLTVQLLGQNLLQQPNVVVDAIIVRDADPNIRIIPYVRGVDYEIIQIGAFTGFNFSIAGSQITDGKNLLITYSFLVNPSIKYQTSSRKFGASLSLSGRHIIYGDFARSEQELLSGRTDLLQLNSATNYTLGFSSEIGRLSFGIQNAYINSTLDKHSSYEGFVRYSHFFPQSTLLCQSRDRYTLYGVTAANRNERSENVFNVTVNYTKPLFRNAIAIASATYTNTRGGAIVRDDAELGVNFQWGYGKIYLTLAGKIYWRDLAGTTSLDNQASVQVARYF